MAGLIGLANNIRTTEGATRDLSILERMDSRIQEDRQKNVEAQKDEQLLYEKSYAYADTLLDKDRNRINARIRLAQKQIGDHMRKSGGSRSRFMEQGGLGIMNQISNDIIRSPEAVQYQENKKNLAKIYQIQEKGFGHLISPKDLKSLEDHQNNPNGGPISYSGMLAEIKIPPAIQFDYDTNIPYEKIMSFDSNMIKIMGNFEIVHPDKEPTHANIVAFMKEMGYGGQGANTIKLRTQAIKAASYARAKRNSPIKADKLPKSFLNQYNEVVSEIPEGLNIKRLNEEFGGDIIEHMRKDNSAIGKLLGRKTNFTSRQRNLSEKGFDSTDIIGSSDKSIIDTIGAIWTYFTNDHMGLKNSYEIMPQSKYKITETAFEGQYEIVDGYIENFEPTEDMYRMDGVQLDGDHKLDLDDHKGRYKVLGVMTALKAKVASEDGRYALLVNTYDDNGELDEKATEKLDTAYGDKEKGIGGSEMVMTQVIALENKNEDIFYKEINLQQPSIKSIFAEAIGAAEDITDAVDQSIRSTAQKDFYKQMDKEEAIRMTESLKVLNEKVFQDPIFEQEGEKYWGSYSGGQENRYPLMKSFYMASDYINNINTRSEEFPQGDINVYPDQIKKSIDANLFTTYAITGGIEEDLKSYKQGHKQERIIEKWLENTNANYEKNSQDYQIHQELAQKWMQLLSLSKQ